MPYYDAEGNEVEGLHTQEALDAKLEEERTTLNAEFEEKHNASQQHIGELEAEATAAKAAVDAAAAGGGGEAGGDKDENLAALRTKLDETNTALEAERTTNKERFEKEENERVSSSILEIAGGDEALAEKIRHNYTATLSGVVAETAAEIQSKVQNAFKLSADVDTAPNPLDVARTGGSMGAPAVINQGKGKPMSEKAVEAGKMFGISDADRDKYAADPRLKHKA